MRQTPAAKISGWSSTLLVSLFSSLAYYGFRSILLLYLMQTLSIDPVESLEIFSAFISLHFISQVLCGWVSDHYIGNQRGIWLGGAFIFMGGLLAFLNAPLLNFISIALFVLGTSFCHVNVITLFGKIHEGHDGERDFSFTIFKIIGNVSVFLGAVGLGSFFEVTSFKSLAVFACGLSGLGACVGAYMQRHRFGYHGLTPSVRTDLQKALGGPSLNLFYGFVFLTGLLLTAFLLWKNEWLGVLIPIFLAISLIVALQISLMKKAFSSMMLIFILFLFHVMYLTIFHHASALWVLFVNSNLDRSLEAVLGFSFLPKAGLYQEIPLVFVKSLNAFFVMLIGPFVAFFWVLTRRHKRGQKQTPQIFSKVALGLCLTAISFSVLTLSRKYASEDGTVSVLWFFGGHFFYALGELLILPITLSALTRLAPKENKTLLVGIWLMGGAVSIYLNKYVTKLFFADVYTPGYDSVCSLNQYCDAFGFLSWIAFALALISFVLFFFEKKMMKS